MRNFQIHLCKKVPKSHVSGLWFKPPGRLRFGVEFAKHIV